MLQSVNVGDIVVKQVGWSMVIYEFFKVFKEALFYYGVQIPIKYGEVK